MSCKYIYIELNVRVGIRCIHSAKIWQVNKIGARPYSTFGILAIAPIILQGNKTGCHVYRTIYLAEQILEIIFCIGYIEPYCNNFHIQHAQPPELLCRLYMQHGTNCLVTGK